MKNGPGWYPVLFTRQPQLWLNWWSKAVLLNSCLKYILGHAPVIVLGVWNENAFTWYKCKCFNASIKGFGTLSDEMSITVEEAHMWPLWCVPHESTAMCTEARVDVPVRASIMCRLWWCFYDVFVLQGKWFKPTYITLLFQALNRNILVFFSLLFFFLVMPRKAWHQRSRGLASVTDESTNITGSLYKKMKWKMEEGEEERKWAYDSIPVWSMS